MVTRVRSVPSTSNHGLTSSIRSSVATPPIPTAACRRELIADLLLVRPFATAYAWGGRPYRPPGDGRPSRASFRLIVAAYPVRRQSDATRTARCHPAVAHAPFGGHSAPHSITNGHGQDQ